MQHNDLMNKKHKKTSRSLNYFEHFLFFFVSAVSSYLSISAFPLLVGISINITSSAVELKRKKEKSVIK